MEEEMKKDVLDSPLVVHKKEKRKNIIIMD